MFMETNRVYYIIENHSMIKKVSIIKFIGGLYTISIEGTSKFLRVHPSRIYTSYTDASDSVEADNKNTDLHRKKNGQLL